MRTIKGKDENTKGKMIGNKWKKHTQQKIKVKNTCY